MNKPRRLWPVVVVATLLFVLYVASFGPVCWLFAKIGDPPKWAHRVDQGHLDRGHRS